MTKAFDAIKGGLEDAAAFLQGDITKGRVAVVGDEADVVYRLLKRAEIRRQITTRKSVQEGQPDRIADLLEDAAKEILELRTKLRGEDE